MEKTLLVIGLLMLIGSLYNIQSDLEAELATQFANYQTTFNKYYSKSELLYRQKARNERVGRLIFGETQYTHLTDQEFAANYLTLKLNSDDYEIPKAQFNNVNATPIDWRTRGAVQYVKNQGQCGSCQAFSSTGVLEGFFKVTTGELLDLSEQQLMDCTNRFTQGCNRGVLLEAFSYVNKNGITTQEAYPYVLYQINSLKDWLGLRKGDPYKINGKTDIAAYEAAFQAALQIELVSVAVKISDWKNYKPTSDNYIFPDSECKRLINHAILAVGFTSEAVIVKNSWSI